MSKESYAEGYPLISGETVTPARYVCTACGTTVEPEQTTNLPVCPNCQNEHWELD